MIPGPRLEAVRRIAVLRPNAVGDHVFALPALEALRAAYPQARMVLLGRRWHCDFLAGRPGPVDEVIEMPTVPGVGAPPEAPCDPPAVERWLQPLRAQRFDLAVQLHGGGGYSNPFVQRLQARLSIGQRAVGAPPLDRWVHYELWRNERLRLLDVVALVGAAPVDLAPRIALTARDAAELRACGPLPPGQPLVVLQPGATDVRRRWPVERFAAVGDALAARGAAVVINGSPDEQALAQQLAGAMRAPALNLAGRLSLRGLVALLARARLMVSNDTGPLHLAHALGTPCVGIFWVLNVVQADALVARRWRVAVALRLQCPVCGVENVQHDCGHRVSFVAEVPVEAVRGMAMESLAEDEPPPPQR